jgi:hypothetical protein
VAPKGGIRAVVDIIPKKLYAIRQTQRMNCVEQQSVARPILSNDVGNRRAFRGAVLYMPHVDIKSSPTEKESAVTCRFLPVSLMQIDESVSAPLEDPVSDSMNNFRSLPRGFHQTAELGLKADDSSVTCWFWTHAS